MALVRFRPLSSGVDPFRHLSDMRSEMKTELPGLADKDIHLSITGDILTLRGERVWNRDVKQENYYRAERWFGKFERALPLPIAVQADKVKASYRDGVLTVTLPKAEGSSPRRSRSIRCRCGSGGPAGGGRIRFPPPPARHREGGKSHRGERDDTWQR
jgi:hypothetical protein